MCNYYRTLNRFEAAIGPAGGKGGAQGSSSEGWKTFDVTPPRGLSTPRAPKIQMPHT